MTYNFRKWMKIGSAIIGMAAIFYSISFGFAENKELDTLQQPALFWYQISATGTLEELKNEVAQTKDDSMPDGSNPLTGCDDTAEDDCLRGYETEQDLNIPAPSVPDDDHRIRFSD